MACGDSAPVRELAEQASCEVITYGHEAPSDLRVEGAIHHGPGGSRFTIRDPDDGPIEITLPLGGDHNVSNALGVWAVARHDGVPARQVASAMSRFHGVKRRMEELGSAAGITVVDDFAHHPTALRETTRALRERYPGRRLVTLFEPRSLTAGRNFLFDAYLEAGRQADVLLLAPIFHHDRLAPEERLDREALVRALCESGVDARACDNLDDLYAAALATVRHGDVVVTMSSGDFAAMPHRLLEALREVELG